MIYKFFKGRGSGSARSSTDYLLGKNGDRPGAKVLRGNARETALLADSLKFKNKFSVGCLSFEEGDISPEAKEEIMDEFERAMFADLERDRYNILWVEHTDKGRLELNFLIPKVDLKTGRSITPYLTGKDTERLGAWRDYTNAKHGLTDPNDPAKKQITQLSDRLPQDRKELIKAINESMTDLAANGIISSRAHIIEHLEAAGFNVARQTNQSISLADPSGGRNIRLKGALYEAEFAGFNGKFKEEYEERNRQYESDRAGRAAAARAKFERLVAAKSEEYRSRLDEREQANRATNRERPPAADRAAVGTHERDISAALPTNQGLTRPSPSGQQPSHRAANHNQEQSRQSSLPAGGERGELEGRDQRTDDQRDEKTKHQNDISSSSRGHTQRNHHDYYYEGIGALIDEYLLGIRQKIDRHTRVADQRARERDDRAQAADQARAERERLREQANRTIERHNQPAGAGQTIRQRYNEQAARGHHAANESARAANQREQQHGESIGAAHNYLATARAHSLIDGYPHNRKVVFGFSMVPHTNKIERIGLLSTQTELIMSEGNPVDRTLHSGLAVFDVVESTDRYGDKMYDIDDNSGYLLVSDYYNSVRNPLYLAQLMRQHDAKYDPTKPNLEHQMSQFKADLEQATATQAAPAPEPAKQPQNQNEQKTPTPTPTPNRSRGMDI